MFKLGTWGSENTTVWARRFMYWFALFGLFVASYLSIVYISGTDLVCGPLKGCDIVRASSWSSWFGIPTPIFGVVFYATVLALLTLRTLMPEYKTKLAYYAQLLLAVAGFAESIFLTYIQKYVLNSFCFWCLLSAVAATCIFITIWWDKPSAYGKDRSLTELKIVFVSLALAVVGGFVGIYLLTRPVPRTSSVPSLQQGQSDKILVPESKQDEQTATSTKEEPRILRNWTPIQGPASSKVTLVEFFDFECPGCGLYHKLVIKPLRDKYAGRIRFAVRNLPLTELHKNAVPAALAGVCANQQGKFFEFYDMMYANQPKVTRADAESYAQALGMDMQAFKACEDAPETLALVLKDRQDAQAFGITGTPTMIINDGLIEGTPNLEAMSQLIDERLK